MESKPSPSVEKRGFSSPISPLMGIGTSSFGGEPTLRTVKLSSSPDSGDGENPDVPKPLEALQEPPVPPFLTKTYELVDDPTLDPTVSWGLNGESFVVWDHADFAQTILPRHFKHGNFSSFVRQLNTYVGIVETEPEMAAVIYSSCFAAESISVKSRCIMYIRELGRFDSGFRKVDSDRWEFANEDFLRGKKHLLKNIHRRKSLQIQPSGHFVGSSFEAGKVGLELQVEKLRHGKNILMQEVLKLQQQQRLAASQMDLMNQRLQAAEQRQKQMLSFLTKVIQNPAFLIHLIHQKERRKMGSSRIKRKFLKQQQSNQSYSGSSMEGQIVRYGADLGDTAPSLGMPELQSTEIPDYLLPDIAMKHDFDASPETKIGNILLDKTKLSIEVAQEPVTVLDQKSAGISSLQLLDSPNVFLNGNNDLSSQTDGVYSDAWFFPPSPESNPPEKTHSTSGLHFEASEPIIKQEEIFNMGFDSGVSDHSSSCNIWENSFNYEVQELDGDGGLCSFWDLQQAEEASRINPWDGDGYYLDDLDSQIEDPKQDHPQLLHQEWVPF